MEPKNKVFDNVEDFGIHYQRIFGTGSGPEGIEGIEGMKRDMSAAFMYKMLSLL